MGTFSEAATPLARETIAGCLAIVKSRRVGLDSRPDPIHKSEAVWNKAELAFKRMLCKSAGLDLAVAEKPAKDLAATERMAIREISMRLERKAQEFFSL